MRQTIKIQDLNQPLTSVTRTRIHAGVIAHHIEFLTDSELESYADMLAADEEDRYQDREENW